MDCMNAVNLLQLCFLLVNEVIGTTQLIGRVLSNNELLGMRYGLSELERFGNRDTDILNLRGHPLDRVSDTDFYIVVNSCGRFLVECVSRSSAVQEHENNRSNKAKARDRGDLCFNYTNAKHEVTLLIFNGICRFWFSLLPHWVICIVSPVCVYSLIIPTSVA